MSVKFKRWHMVVLSFILFLMEGLGSTVSGFQIPAETIQFHGFASQGLILTSENNFFGESKKGSLEFTELGINTSFRPTQNLQASVQVLSRRAGEGGNGDLRLDYAILDYRFFSDESKDFHLRVGRVKIPLGLYNDTRDVAFTRPSIFLPQSIYFDRTRNLALSADGVNFYAEHRNGFGNLFYELEIGYPEVDDPETERTVPQGMPGSLDNRVSYASRLIFEQDEGKVRIALSGAAVNIQFQPVSMARAGTIRFIPVILSAQYNAEFWSFTSEYARRFSKFRNVFPGPEVKRTGESFYFQGSYRFFKRWEALLRYDVLYQNRDDRDGSQTLGKPGYTQFAKDWTTGLRWDITDTLMSRIEYHYVDGTAWLPSLDNPSAAATKRYWNMYAFLISYRF